MVSYLRLFEDDSDMNQVTNVGCLVFSDCTYDGSLIITTVLTHCQNSLLLHNP